MKEKMNQEIKQEVAQELRHEINPEVAQDLRHEIKPEVWQETKHETKNQRLYYIDWLRVLVILTLIPFHGALTYTVIGDVYIKSPIKDIRVIPFTTITAILDNFFMTLLFFLSGIGTFYALKHRDKSEYKIERRKKLLLPFILGFLLLCPIQAYTKGLHNGFSGDFLHFVPQFFSKKIVYYLGYGHLWFLLYLFLISLFCLPLFTKWLSDKTRLNNLCSSLCKGNKVLIPIGYICLLELILRPISSGTQTIIGDWANDVIYSSMFVFGFVYASNLQIQERVRSLLKYATIVLLIGTPLLMIIYYMFNQLSSAMNLYGLLWLIIRGAYECSAIIVLLEVGRKYLNRKSALLSYLNKASFTYYLIHFLPVSVFSYFLVTTKLNVYIKYLLVVVLSYIFTLAIYELLRRIRKKLVIAPSQKC